MLVLVSPVESISPASSALSLRRPSVPAGMYLPPAAPAGSALPGLGETPAVSSQLCAAEGSWCLLLVSGSLGQVPSQPCAWLPGP